MKEDTQKLAAKIMGRRSSEVRFEGKTKEEISEIMRELGKKPKKKKKK